MLPCGLKSCQHLFGVWGEDLGTGSSLAWDSQPVRVSDLETSCSLPTWRLPEQAGTQLTPSLWQAHRVARKPRPGDQRLWVTAQERGIDQEAEAQGQEGGREACWLPRGHRRSLVKGLELLPLEETAPFTITDSPAVVPRAHIQGDS